MRLPPESILSSKTSTKALAQGYRTFLVCLYKLECFSTTGFSRRVYSLRVRSGAFPRVKQLEDASLRWAPVLSLNIRLGQKGLPGKNTLAYYENSCRKKFYSAVPWLLLCLPFSNESINYCRKKFYNTTTRSMPPASLATKRERKWTAETWKKRDRPKKRKCRKKLTGNRKNRMNRKVCPSIMDTIPLLISLIDTGLMLQPK